MKIYHADFSDVSYNKYVLSMASVFVAIYVGLYRIMRSKVNQSAEYECRVITFIHGVIAISCSLGYVVLPALGLYKVEVAAVAPIILSHSLGYFIFDSSWCFFHGEHPIMKFHHILTVTGLVYYMFKKSKQFYIVYAIGLTEFTNPFLQARWFLKHYGMREGTTFKIIESLLIVMFFAIRIVVLTIYLYDAFTSKEMDFHPDDLIFSALGVLTGYALSIQMFNYIIHQMKKSKRNKSE